MSVPFKFSTTAFFSSSCFFNSSSFCCVIKCSESIFSNRKILSNQSILRHQATVYLSFFFFSLTLLTVILFNSKPLKKIIKLHKWQLFKGNTVYQAKKWFLQMDCNSSNWREVWKIFSFYRIPTCASQMLVGCHYQLKLHVGERKILEGSSFTWRKLNENC